MKFEEEISKIKDIDIKSTEDTKQKLLKIAKPIYGLGLIEENFIKISGIQRSSEVDISKKALVVMCSDNGVVTQGVSQTTQDVTAKVALQLAEKNTVVCKMSDVAGVDVFTVDIGICEDILHKEIINRKIAYGTSDISQGAAMSRKDAAKAIDTGIELAEKLKEKGYNIILTGEMGIGNTTTSTACACSLLNLEPSKYTGHGAGLSAEALNRKVDAIKNAILINELDNTDPIDVLHKLGGFDIAGMIGLFIGGSVNSMPIVIDGLISCVAALFAYKIAPKTKDYMIASHMSDEPLAKLLLKELDLKPMLFAEMALGEGTGAVAIMPLFDMMSKIYYEVPQFSEMEIKEYKDYGKGSMI